MLVTVTVAPGTAAPAWSFTTPVILPAAAWADRWRADPARQISRNGRKRTGRITSILSHKTYEIVYRNILDRLETNIHDPRHLPLYSVSNRARAGAGGGRRIGSAGCPARHRRAVRKGHRANGAPP